MILPTVGRVLWFHQALAESFLIEYAGQPMSVQVCAVIDDQHVNVAGFDAEGNPFARQNVRLIQDDEAPPENGEQYVEWMPFQKGQAAAQSATTTETKTYTDGTLATGAAPLPNESPTQQDAAASPQADEAQQTTTGEQPDAPADNTAAQ